MKINLEFNNTEEFFDQLPKFAALINFSGQFANITKGPKLDVEMRLDAPNLPEIDHLPDRKRVNASDTVNGKAAAEAVEKAFAEAEAMGAAKPSKVKPEDRIKPSDEPEAEAEQDAEQEPTPAPGAKPATVDAPTVRKALNELIKAGKREKIKKILGKYGAERFTELAAEHYAEVLEKVAETLGKDISEVLGDD